jgi:F0F1-type ATP synthase membrane subunit b/b'
MKSTIWFSKVLLAALVVTVAASTVGCGKAMKSASSGGTVAERQASVDQHVKEAQQASKDAQDALTAAQAALAQISDPSGNFNLGLFSGLNGQVSLSNLLGPLTDKLKAVFDQVYDKLALVKQKYSDARAVLADATANLNPNDPVQAQLIAQINAELANLESLEAKYTSSIHMLASKLTLVSNSLDRIVNGVTNVIPGFGSIVGLALDFFVLDDVKNLIADFQTKLLAL